MGGVHSCRSLHGGPLRTTLDLNDALLARAKAEAARQGTTLTRLIEEGLALRLRAARGRRASARRDLPVFRGGSGLAPGVDPSSNRSLYEAADAEEDDRKSRRRA